MQEKGDRRWQKERARAGEVQRVEREERAVEARQVRKCGERLCGLCEVLSTSREFKSEATHRRYLVYTRESEVLMTCQTNWLVYLATCGTCGLQYVGSTKNRLNRRFAQHRSAARADGRREEYQVSHSKFFTKHVEECCGWRGLEVQPLEAVQEPAVENKEGSEKEKAKKLREREMFWVGELHTGFPFGLNDKVELLRQADTMAERFNHVSRRHGKEKKEKRKSRRARQKSARRQQMQTFDEEGFLDQCEEELSTRGWVFEVRKKVKSLKKTKLAQVVKEAEVRAEERKGSVNRLARVVIDLGKAGLGELREVKELKERGQLCKLTFHNPGFNKLGLARLLNQDNLKNLLPEVKVSKVEVVYKYVESVRRKLLNYKRVLEQAEGRGAAAEPCTCSRSKFTDKRLGHVCTGDLTIVRNRSLRRLLELGPKYRERRSECWKEVEEEVERALDELVGEWSRREDVTEETFGAWKAKAKETVKERVKVLRKRGEEESKEVLKDRQCQEELRKLQEKYVLVSADKSENNVVVVCRKFYVEQVEKELEGEGKEEEKKTYEKSRETKEELVERLVRRVEGLGFKVQDEQRRLAVLYWTAKMHKDPPSQRYIASSRKCVTKELSKAIGRCLKKLQSVWKRRCARERRRNGVNGFWIVQSTKEALERVQEANREGNVNRVGSFDFSTLFTTLEHESLVEEIGWVVREGFRTMGEEKELVVRGGEAYWRKKTDKVRDGDLIVTAETLIEWVRVLVESVYVVYGETAWRQKVGVPMGTDCAPFLANLYLFAKEYKWIRQKVEEGEEELAKSLRHTSRYVDDLLALNDGGTLLRHWQDIYPPNLSLQQENRHNWKTHFLDFNLVINQRLLVLSTYDKREGFPFVARSFPNLSGNIHFGRSHGVVVGQLSRFALTNTHYEKFVKKTKSLVAQLLNQGFAKRRLLTYCTKYFGQAREVWKYRRSTVQFQEDCFG